MDYNYDLPEGMIANNPSDPRDSARLLVYKTKTGEIIEDIFLNLAKYLPDDSVLVLNDTKVVPARIEFSKLTGGKLRVLFLVNERGNVNDSRTSWSICIKGLSDRKLATGDRLFIGDREIVEVVSKSGGEYVFKLLVDLDEFDKLVNDIGRTPLPPYIHSDLSEDEARLKYQTIFSKPFDRNSVGSATSSPVVTRASVAAPTASLHFTDKVFDSLVAKHIQKTFVTLHVGRGTFLPLGSGEPRKDKNGAQILHEEPIYVPSTSAVTIARAKEEGRTVIASGTTVTRTLESAKEYILGIDDSEVVGTKDFNGATSIFIKPPYDFKIVDAMITNFHLPNTSLLMLLDAFLQYKKSSKTWRDIYDYAIKNGFKFYSFGDAMLVL